ncbi:hypothetical protein KGP36_06125 [Patescibacteria group bacterium]|nr:hypothetical protein [Patescibacteria group bacterium]
MLVEVEDQELNVLKSYKLAADKITGNPKMRMKYLQLLKEAFPNEAIPEIDAAEPVYDRISGLEKKFDEYIEFQKKEREEALNKRTVEELETRLSEGRRSLSRSGYTEEGIKAVEALMEKKGITDHEAGAALYEKTNPPETPVEPSTAGGFNFLQPDDSDEMTKLLFKDPDQFINKMIPKTLKELRAQGRR